MAHTGFDPLTVHAVSRSALLRLQGALQGRCPKRALCFVHFLGLSSSGSGSQVLHGGTDSVGPAFCALPRSEQLRQPAAWPVHCPRWALHLTHLLGPSSLVSRVRCGSTVSGVPCVSSGELVSGCDPASYSPSRSQPLGSPGALRERRLRCAVCLLWGAGLRLRPSWWMSTIQEPRKTWLATGSLLTVWWRTLVSGAEIGVGPCLPALAVPCLPLCLQRLGRACMQPASSPLVLAQPFVL